jgi:hypothetical protein
VELGVGLGSADGGGVSLADELVPSVVEEAVDSDCRLVLAVEAEGVAVPPHAQRAPSTRVAATVRGRGCIAAAVCRDRRLTRQA